MGLQTSAPSHTELLLAPGHEGEAFEHHNVLFVLEQGAV